MFNIKYLKEIEFIKIFVAILFLLVVAFNLGLLGNDHFVKLAESFASGHLYFSEEYVSDLLARYDTVQINDKFYWPLGPLPAVLLMPFLFLTKFYSVNLQGLLNIFLVLATFFIVYRVSKKQGFIENDAIFLAIAFCFASMFMGVALRPSSWYFAHTVTVLFIFIALLEYFSKKRLWIIGILFGLIALTRMTATIGIIFFILDIFLNAKDSFRIKFDKLVKLLLPFALLVMILLFYNYARFNNFFEQGYTNQILIEAHTKARSYGILSIKHLPGNLYYALLSVPEPVFKDQISHVLTFPFIKSNWWGMSIFVTSPYLLCLFFMKLKDRLSKLLLITVFLVAVPLFLYYGIGYVQFGYRYALDFMPFLFLLFIKNYYDIKGKLTFNIKSVLLASLVFNMYLFLTFLYGANL